MRRTPLFTDEQKRFILEHYHDTSGKDLAVLMNESFGINVTAKQIDTWRQRWGYTKTKPNKTKLVKPDKLPGHTLPIGSKRSYGDGYVWVKYNDNPKPKTFSENWRKEHLLVWEEAYGPVPEGCFIVHINRNKSDNRLENLVCVSKRVITYMHRHNLWSEDPEILKANLLIAEIHAQISKRRGKGYKRITRPHKKTGRKKALD